MTIVDLRPNSAICCFHDFRNYVLLCMSYFAFYEPPRLSKQHEVLLLQFFRTFPLFGPGVGG